MAWVNRFPQFADDIRAHAAVAWDWATQTVDSEVEVDESMAARAYSEALNIIYAAENSTESAQTVTQSKAPSSEALNSATTQEGSEDK